MGSIFAWLVVLLVGKFWLDVCLYQLLRLRYLWLFEILLLVQRTSSGRQRKNWSPGNDPFNKGNTEPALLGGRIEGALDQLEEDDTNEKRKSSTASSSTASSCSKSTYLHDVDNVVLHHIICLMMEYLSHSQAVNAKKCRIEDLRELMTTLRTCLTALTSAKNEEDLSFKPQELR